MCFRFSLTRSRYSLARPFRWVSRALVAALLLAGGGACQDAPDGISLDDTPHCRRDPIVAGARSGWWQYPEAGLVNIEGYGTCTGTLIAPDVVLTAAHCVPPGH